jgi:hypothetical protein
MVIKYRRVADEKFIFGRREERFLDQNLEACLRVREGGARLHHQILAFRMATQTKSCLLLYWL